MPFCLGVSAKTFPKVAKNCSWKHLFIPGTIAILCHNAGLIASKDKVMFYVTLINFHGNGCKARSDITLGKILINKKITNNRKCDCKSNCQNVAKSCQKLPLEMPVSTRYRSDFYQNSVLRNPLSYDYSQKRRLCFMRSRALHGDRYKSKGDIFLAQYIVLFIMLVTHKYTMKYSKTFIAMITLVYLFSHLITY